MGPSPEWIIQELFALTPLMDGHEAEQERAANPTLNWLRQLCLAAEADAHLEESLTASDLVEICHRRSVEIPGLASDAAEEKAKLRVGCILGKAFKERESIEVDGFGIQRVEAIQYSDERRREVTSKRYAIRRFALNSAQQSQRVELF